VQSKIKSQINGNGNGNLNGKCTATDVGAAEGCDLLILKIKGKRSQPSAAPTGVHMCNQVER
jgi:hypothetical protein